MFAPWQLLKWMKNPPCLSQSALSNFAWYVINIGYDAWGIPLHMANVIKPMPNGCDYFKDARIFQQ